MKRLGRIRLFIVFLLSVKTQGGFLRYYTAHPGQRYGNMSRRVTTRQMGDCNILCSSQRPKPCKAYNYRSSDGSCELIVSDSSSLIPFEGYQAYVQNLCLTEHPMVENANVTYVGWDGRYPALNGAKVLFHCEKGFTDGKMDHWTICSDTPDTWCTSFVVGRVSCPKPDYPDCRKTEKGKEYIGRKKKTETGKDCIRWDRQPYEKPKDFSLEMRYNEHFFNEDAELSENYCRNPALRERPWCFVSDRAVQWEYCDIPLCEDLHPLECKLTQKGAEYMGKENTTLDGIKCLPWLSVPLTSQYRSWAKRTLAFSDEVDEKHNYCRNPGGRLGGPWCYDGKSRKDQEVGWHYCDVRFCHLQEKETDENHETNANFPNCRITKMGKEYMGMIRMSETGKPCMKWLDFWSITKYPEPMLKILPLTNNFKLEFKYFFPDNDPNFYVNFCRNPGWGQRPWCFVSRPPAIEWEYCDIPFCKDRVPLECAMTSLGLDYMGKMNVTSEGMPCDPWLNYSNHNYLRDMSLQLFPDPVDSRHNYCRYSKWNDLACLVFQGDKFHHVSCSVPFCYELLESIHITGGEGKHVYPQCLLTEKGREYIGTEAKTSTGKVCLSWVETIVEVEVNPLEAAFKFANIKMETRQKRDGTVNVRETVKFSAEQKRAILLYHFRSGLKPQQAFEEMKKNIGDDAPGTTMAFEEMKKNIGDDAPGRTMVFKWFQRFEAGHFEVTDDPRSGRPRTSTDDGMVAAVAKFLEEEPSATTKRLADVFRVSKTSISSILHDQLDYSEKSARWVPRLLKPEKEARKSARWVPRLLKPEEEARVNF
ncbi:unnamed protein product [Darwinula stevensoni]|uniref:Hepatocyte growth factor-like protein n=1 Tax=Darwinula stevensoni TaxID=69355 RepID=A0A7R9AC73_9CRUS|nr:unnamed protein product [Darwinula stevensoni]CAG0899927.1 unnamed protein product [Darwinula stevensoni]